MTITTLAGVTYAARPRAAQYASALVQPPKLIVVHDTSNDATKEQEASYAAKRTDDRSRWTSAHFYVDDAGVIGSVPLNLQAWAAYAYANRVGIHIEMCGMNAGLPGAVTPRTIANTAALVADLTAEFKIPAMKRSPAQVAAGARGICGHYDVTIGLNVGDHTDPGPRFDWAAFMRLVTEGDDMQADERQWLRDIHYAMFTADAANRPAGSVTGKVESIRAQVAKLSTGGVDVDQLAEKIAAKIAPNLSITLGEDDKPAIVDAVKAALREGVA